MSVAIALGRRKRAQRDEAVLGHDRLFLQHNFAIKRSHAGVVGRIFLLLGVASSHLFFTRVLGHAQLVEIVLFFVGDQLFLEQQPMLYRFHLHVLAAGEDFVASVFF